jgi:hypothetical protein
MQVSLAELISGLPLKLDREFLAEMDRVRSRMQLTLRRLAENDTREDVPGQPYLPLDVQRVLRTGIEQGWGELHLTIVDRILKHHDLARVDTDALLGEITMLVARDAKREWAELTCGKFAEAHADFDGQGNIVHHKLVTFDWVGGPMMILDRVTEVAKMKALELKAAAPAGMALAATVEAQAAAAPSTTEGNDAGPPTREELDKKLKRHVKHAKATGDGFRSVAAFLRSIGVDKGDYSRWKNNKPDQVAGYVKLIPNAILKLTE